jgi:hypothetical protein
MSQDFGKGKIYKITNDYNDEVYVGSTCDLLTKRFSYHRGDHRKERCKNIPIYKLMNEIGFERFRIELIEDYQCQDKYQLRQREGHFIREIGTLNKLIAGRTKQEYNKEYAKDNKDKLGEYKKEYYEINKDKIQENNKEWREVNKDKISEQGKEYYLNNKDKIHDRQKEKITCECGFIISRVVLSRHKRSVKHQELMKTILTPIIH